MNINTEQVFIVNASELDQHTSTTLQGAFAIPVAGSSLQPEEAQTSMCLSQSLDVPSRTRMCRLCATVTEMVVPIFEGEGLQNNLADKIHQHLPIQVTAEDVLPIVMCYQCTSTLLAWHELVECSIQADSIMKERFSLSIPVDKQQQNNVKSQQMDIKDEKAVVEAAQPVAAQVHACESCGRAFTSRGNLTRHARAVHGSSRVHACSCCAARFTRAEHLREHERRHAGPQQFLCDSCGHASPSRAALRMHRLVHAAPRHACSSCGAGFKRAGELAAHRSVHDGRKPHACTRCARAFRLRAQLTRHARSHDRHLHAD